MAVKSIVIDENSSSQLNKMLADYKPASGEANSMASISKTGLLVGNITNNTDYILNVISTPLIGSSSTSIDSLKKAPTSPDTIDSEWILNHALQVHDMLIGGMDILGLYCIDVNPSTAKQLLIKLFKSLNGFEYYKKMKFNSDRLLFLVDSATKNINMKSFDYSLSDAKFQSCDIKIQKNLFADQFFRLHSNFDLNSKFKTPNVKAYNLTKEDFYNALSVDAMFDNDRFLCLINNCLLDEAKSFNESVQLIKKNKTENRELEKFKTSGNDYFATLLENLSCDSEKYQKPENSKLDAIYELTGVCNLIALFHTSHSIMHIKKLLIYDFLRSMYARIRLLVEDLDLRKDVIGDVQLDDPNSNDVSAIEESYQTPNRIHIRSQSPDIVLTDYAFPEETELDVKERIRDIFSLDLQDNIVYAEDLPPEIRISSSENLNEKSDSSSNLHYASGTRSDSLRPSNKTTSSSSAAKNLAFYLSVLLLVIVLSGFIYVSFDAARFSTDDDGEL